MNSTIPEMWERPTPPKRYINLVVAMYYPSYNMWRNIARWCCFALCILVSGASELNQDGTRRVQQRQIFYQAELAIKEGREADYHTLRWSLHDYPLLSYLDYKNAITSSNANMEGAARDFLQHYPDTHLAERLRNDFLSRLANDGRWQEFLDIAPTHIGPIKLRCQKISALLATGQEQQAFVQIKSLFLSGRPQPDPCEMLFTIWSKSKYFNSDLVWQRIALAVKEDQPTLVRNLKDLLPLPEHEWVDRWLRLASNPGLILDHKEFSTPHPWRETILTKGFCALARKFPSRAPASWQIINNRYPFNDDQKAEARHAVAKAYLRFADPRVLEGLSNIDGFVDVDLQQRRVILALIRNGWIDVNARIAALPPEERFSPQWVYWRGRALQQLGRSDEAKTVFTPLAKDRTYYAFLAADRGGLDYYLLDKSLQIEANQLQSIAQRKCAMRAHELRYLGRMADARLEWRWLIKNLDHQELQAAARLAGSWGWHDQAIFTLVKSDFWDDLSLRFPLEHQDLITRYAAENGIPVAWAFAIMRQESAFAPDAVSPSGALGLMQLMPTTANEVAQGLNLTRPNREELLRPEINIRLGTSYLNKVATKFGGNLVLATAAYNAGPNRVKKWLPNAEVDADIWVETIPFQETKTYVQRVMTYMILYEQRLGIKPGSIVARMRSIPPAKN